VASLPKSQDLIKPILKVLKDGQVISNATMRDEVARVLMLDSDSLSLIHSGSRTEFEYRLAWARTNCKARGLIISPKRMHWQITEDGKSRI